MDTGRDDCPGRDDQKPSWSRSEATSTSATCTCSTRAMRRSTRPPRASAAAPKLAGRPRARESPKGVSRARASLQQIAPPSIKEELAARCWSVCQQKSCQLAESIAKRSVVPYGRSASWRRIPPMQQEVIESRLTSRHRQRTPAVGSRSSHETCPTARHGACRRREHVMPSQKSTLSHLLPAGFVLESLLSCGDGRNGSRHPFHGGTR